MKVNLISVAILLVVAASTASQFAGRSAKLTEHALIPALLNSSRPVDQTEEANRDIKVVLLTLRPEGFEPQEMQLSAGEYLLIAKNRTGLDELNLRLARDNGEHVSQAKVGARRKDWKQRLKLSPGTYRLTESSHPEWSCRIVVEG